MASEMLSHILSGWPSVTLSEVKKAWRCIKVLLRLELQGQRNLVGTSQNALADKGVVQRRNAILDPAARGKAARAAVAGDLVAATQGPEAAPCVFGPEVKAARARIRRGQVEVKGEEQHV